MFSFKKFPLLCCAMAMSAIAPSAFAEDGEVEPGKSYPTTDEVQISELTTNSNGTYFTVSLESNTDITYCAYNMVLALPPGVSFACNSSGKPMAVTNKTTGFYPSEYDELEETTNYLHSFQTSIVDNKLRVICYSLSNANFGHPGGALFNVYVDISPWAKAGANDVTISETKFVTNTEVGYIPTIGVVGSFDVSGENREVPVSITAENKAATCILPFSYTPVGFEAYEADHADSSTLYLKKVEQMEAYQPYVLLAESGYSQTLTGTAEASAYPGTATVTNKGLCGVIQLTQVSEGYVLQNQGSGPTFYRIGETPFSLKAGKCYLNSVSSSSSLAAKFGDDSGIQDINSDIDNGPLYDISGRVVSDPIPGNVYIQNGKKIIKL